MTPAVAALLFGAGAAAGLTGTVAGLASLFSYPALLAVGLPPTAANVTNTVALAAGSAGAIPSSRHELTGQRVTFRRLGAACALGSAAGAALLLATPPGVFERVVPFLVGGASVVILLRQPARESAGGAHPGRGWLAPCGVFVVSVYGGYFAAASGVLLLALLIATVPDGLHRSNALKNVLVIVADLVAALGFAAFGPVAWLEALPLAAGLLLGSWLGPHVARRVPATPLRVGIALAGVGLAVKLGLDAF
ncbi:sulfite exporter TauE/SafE family protein [Streptomyces iconiensis]|uniref:Probable membrane transporter protein n=1 Tax=Streptomyces iconiensis TaxID=1384038 RepID=A0ABT7A0H0_9ACTN|nr:sulfite exporter TauE/SafE family protein [Streptomyces iconiensis]MDJ1134819.1 sulfite exporter TauE/SafE family protein [Streptomyces iconiensis]